MILKLSDFGAERAPATAPLRGATSKHRQPCTATS